MLTSDTLDNIETVMNTGAMFGIKIVRSGDYVVRIAGKHADAQRASGTQLCGSVGLYHARRAYRYMLADWNQSAWSWACGTQDYRGELLDDAKARVVELGGNPKVDRAMVLADKY